MPKNIKKRGAELPESSVLEKEMASRTETFRFFDLPRELRDMVYKSVFTPMLGNRTRKSYDLTPGILRVNKQMHEEAFDILYGQNCWVHFHINYRIKGIVKENLENSQAPLIILQDGSKGSFGGRPSIRIKILEDRSLSHPEMRIVASIFDLPRLFFCLTRTARSESRHIYVGIDKSMTKYPHHCDYLRATLYELRCDSNYFAGTNVTRRDHSGLFRDIDWASMDMSFGVPEMKDASALLGNITRYQGRGDHELALGNIQNAAMIYKDGYHFTDWGRRLAYEHLSITLDFWTLREFKQRAGLITSNAVCNLRQGFYRNAERLLEENLYRCFLPAPDLAKNYYYLGLTWIEGGRVNEGTFYLMLARALRPESDFAKAVIKEITSVVDKHSIKPFEGENELILRNVGRANVRLHECESYASNLSLERPMSPQDLKDVIAALGVEWVLRAEDGDGTFTGVGDSRFIYGGLQLSIDDFQ